MNPVINEKHPAMSDTDQAEHDQALRAQVRAAGALLGDVLRAQATDGVFDTVRPSMLRRASVCTSAAPVDHLTYGSDVEKRSAFARLDAEASWKVMVPGMS